MAQKRYDLAVVGAGPGGDHVARSAGKRGWRVALIERDKLGGTCLNYGCDPTKTMYRSAQIAHLLRRASTFGVEAGPVRVDFARVMAHKDAVVDQFRGDDPLGGLRRDGVDLVRGEARFRSPHEIEVGETLLEAEKVVIATGSRPAVPPVEGLEEAGYLTNESIMDLPTLPERLLILGGGPNGVEFGQMFARFGSEVTIVEVAERLLTTEEAQVSLALERIFKEEGIRVWTATQARRCVRERGQWVMEVEKAGRTWRQPFDRVLVAAGREPNIEALNLEAAGVRANRKGIEVDGELRTSAEHIWACGDVLGVYQFTHVAACQASVVLANLLEDQHRVMDYSAVPWVIFTDPEVAHVGMTEAQACEAGKKVVAKTMRFDRVARAVEAGEAEGVGKIVVDAETGLVLGANLIGYMAGEVIHELVLAVRMKLSVEEVASTIHAYPTQALGVRGLANKFDLQAVPSPEFHGCGMFPS